MELVEGLEVPTGWQVLSLAYTWHARPFVRPDLPSVASAGAPPLASNYHPTTSNLYSSTTYIAPFVHMTSSTTSKLACAMSCITASPFPPE